MFEAIAANVFAGRPDGAGATTKLVTQYLGYTNFIASIEGMLVAAKAGFGLEHAGPDRAGRAPGKAVLRQYRPRRVHRHLRRRRQPLNDIVAEVLELACQLARDVGAPAALGALASDIYKRAQAQGWGQEGFPIVARVARRWPGPNCAQRIKREAKDER